MKNKKLLTILAIVIGVLVVAVGGLLTYNLWKNGQIYTEDPAKPILKTVDTTGYTDMLKIYSALDDEIILVDTLQEKLAEINPRAKFYADSEGGTITLLKAKNEYISFDVFRDYDDSPDSAVNFVYHDKVGDEVFTIHKSGENTYQHYNGALTNEFDNKDDAIRDHLLHR